MTADFVIAAPPLVSLPVSDETARFPVRRVWCVGRNYLEHIREFNNDERAPPFFFAKPADAVIHDGSVPYPPLTADLHHEVELVVAIGQGGRDIPVEAASAHVFGYAVGIDLTRRDLQRAAQADKKPWETGKAFDASAPCGALMPAARLGHPKAGAITLDVNGTKRQSGDLAQMIWNVAEIIARLSQSVALAPGDLIFTGTPSGVGPVVTGDILSAHIQGLVPLEVRIGPKIA
jgi:fumarylpyruvate hydrolase